MGDRDDEQDQRLDDVVADQQQRDAAQDENDVAQDGRLDAGDTRDTAQDGRLDAIENDTSLIDTELPGISTPQGAEQRLKMHVPIPHTLMTLGSIGKNDANGHAVGAGGFALQTDENFSAQIKKDTIWDSKEDIIFHTPTNYTGVAGEKLHFSTNGDYQLGTVGGISISAASGAGFTDPNFTVDPAMSVPDPATIDTKGPRATTEALQTAWGAVWTAWDVFSGVTSLVGLMKTRKLATGVAADTFHGKAAGTFGAYSSARNLYDAGVTAWNGAVAGFNHFWPPKPKAGPGAPNITMYADKGITLISPDKITLFSGIMGGVSVESPHKVGIKGGVSASMTAGCDASVSAFVSAKLESKGIATVTGHVVSVTGQLTEVIGRKSVMISSDSKIGVESDGSVRLSGAKKIQLVGERTLVNAEKHIMLACGDVINVAGKDIAIDGELKVFIGSDTEIATFVKRTGYTITASEFKAGCDEKSGMTVTKSKANFGTQKSYASFKDSGFSIEGGGASKIKAPSIKIG